MPVPMIPNAKSRYARSPASGRSASAACAAVPMCRKPCRYRVAALVKMMKYMTMFDRNIPTSTSVPDARSSLPVALARAFKVLRPAATSSTRNSAMLPAGMESRGETGPGQ